MDLYPESYYNTRFGNDPKRMKAYALERLLIKKVLGDNWFRVEDVLDIGCSTGEFLEFLDIGENRYGMEISSAAKSHASQLGIKFNKSIFDQIATFDIIFMRGVLQHLENPFEYLNNSFNALKPGGWLFILQTPNINSFYFRHFRTLPALDKLRDFNWPSDLLLKQILSRIKFSDIEISYPYLRSGYDSLLKDCFKICFGILTSNVPNCAFVGNMMNIAAHKPQI